MSGGAWPWGIGLGLGLVVAVNAWMVHLAISHPSVPASADHYAESIRWDEIQAERARAQALGWRVELRPCPRLRDREQDREHDHEHGCTIRLQVRDTAGAPVIGLHGHVRAQRADDAALDREAPVYAGGSAGDYEASLSLARPGLYTVSIRLEGSDAPWVDERSVEIRGAP